jgi:hypothetical protein
MGTRGPSSLAGLAIFRTMVYQAQMLDAFELDKPWRSQATFLAAAHINQADFYVNDIGSA